MARSLWWLGIGLMTVLAVGVALYSFRFFEVLAHGWPLMDPKLRAMAEAYPVRALMHMVIAPIALLVGPFQFIPAIRTHHPRIHRYLGRLYVAACLISGVAGFFTAMHASGGQIAAAGFGLLAVSWIAVTAAAWRAAVKRRFSLHRVLMRYSYAMTFGAVTLRVQIPIGLIFFGFTSYSALSVWLAYTSWIPNVIAVALFTRFEQRRERHAALPQTARV